MLLEEKTKAGEFKSHKSWVSTDGPGLYHRSSRLYLTLGLFD